VHSLFFKDLVAKVWADPVLVLVLVVVVGEPDRLGGGAANVAGGPNVVVGVTLSETGIEDELRRRVPLPNWQ
jgi:hypothetical protein